MKTMLITMMLMLFVVLPLNAQEIPQRQRILSITVVDNVYSVVMNGGIINSNPYVAIVLLADTGMVTVQPLPYIAIIEADVKDIVGNYLYETPMGTVIKSK